MRPIQCPPFCRILTKCIVEERCTDQASSCFSQTWAVLHILHMLSHCSLRIAWQKPSRAARGELGLARGDLSASPSHHPLAYCSFKLIEVIFEPEFRIRHSSIPQLPGSETYKDFSRIASFLLALESCIRRAIASSFFS